jgi:hypothetical protein
MIRKNSLRRKLIAALKISELDLWMRSRAISADFELVTDRCIISFDAFSAYYERKWNMTEKKGVIIFARMIR